MIQILRSVVLFGILSGLSRVNVALAQDASVPRPCATATTSPIASFLTGVATLILGGFIAFLGTFYKDRKGTNAIRRLIIQSHFDLFQDVADCAWNYAEDMTFGIFLARITSQLISLRTYLEKETAVGISDDEYANLYRSLSSVEYVMWAYENKFQMEHMSKYIDQCLDDMASAQASLGRWPRVRPNSSERLRVMSEKYSV